MHCSFELSFSQQENQGQLYILNEGILVCSVFGFLGVWGFINLLGPGRTRPFILPHSQKYAVYVDFALALTGYWIIMTSRPLAKPLSSHF